VTHDEKVFLQELTMDPRWGNVLKKLRRRAVTPYKKGATLEDWAFESGQVRENERILTILAGVDDD
jgi:arginyl-tRNA synthetase